MTYSIVARDPEDGSLGIAVQSAWFAVGHIVPWVNAGVGVVATQSFADPTYGTKGLTLMRNGLTADRALEALLELDSGRESRQVAMVDAQGNTAVHTGNECIEYAEQVSRGQASCQGNILKSAGTCEAMMKAYESATGEFVDRLATALVAAEEMGGDARGRQSSALLVVSGKGNQNLFTDRLFDVRIDDHLDPVGELLRMVKVQRGYRLLDRCNEFFVADEFEAAGDLAEAAAELLPTDVNVVMWCVMTLMGCGRADKARELAEVSRNSEIDWTEIVDRFARAGEIPATVNTAELKAIVSG